MGIIFGLGPVEISILLLMLAPIGVGAFLLHRDVEKLSLGWGKKLLLLISLLISWPATLITWWVFHSYIFQKRGS